MKVAAASTTSGVLTLSALGLQVAVLAWQHSQRLATMIPKFVKAGKGGGPLRPTGSAKVATDVRPYRVSSGVLRITVRFQHSDASLIPPYFVSASFSSTRQRF